MPQVAVVGKAAVAGIDKKVVGDVPDKAEDKQQLQKDGEVRFPAIPQLGKYGMNHNQYLFNV
jgi:hypothetical protein